jgi:hypothetical protein
MRALNAFQDGCAEGMLSRIQNGVQGFQMVCDVLV